MTRTLRSNSASALTVTGPKTTASGTKTIRCPAATAPTDTKKSSETPRRHGAENSPRMAYSAPGRRDHRPGEALKALEAPVEAPVGALADGVVAVVAIAIVAADGAHGRVRERCDERLQRPGCEHRVGVGERDDLATRARHGGVERARSCHRGEVRER